MLLLLQSMFLLSTIHTKSNTYTCTNTLFKWITIVKCVIKLINQKSRHFKSNNHKNLDNHKHVNLTIDNPNIDNIDKKFYTNINEYDNKYEYYLVGCEFRLCFNNMEDYPFASSNLTDYKTMVSWKVFVESIINKLKKKD